MALGPAYRAPAKVNLFLEVGGLREDGYHDVTSVLVALQFGDTLSLEPADRLSVDCDPPLPVSEESNLAWLAAEQLAKRAGIEPRLSIRIQKRIPSQAGLGGGSSDAAAVLHALATAWGLDPRGEEVQASAAAVGSDVAFFLSNGAALMGGRGEVMLERLPTPDLDVVLVRPPVAIATASAYAAYDRARRYEGRGPDGIVRTLREGAGREAIAEELYNAMTDASVGLEPAVGEALGFLRAQPGVAGALMAGSGSAVFGICDDADSAARVAEAAEARGWWASATRTRPEGVNEEETVTGVGA